MNEDTTQTGRLRAKVALVLGPALFLLLLALPLPLPTEAHRLAAVMALAVVFWIGEPIPLAVTAIVAPGLALLVGAVPGSSAKLAYAKLGDPLLLLFMGGFFIAQAMTVHGLDARIARVIMSRPVFGKSPARMLAGLALTTFALSMWISNTAATAMLIPIALGLRNLADPKRRNAGVGCAFMLAIGFGASIGGLATPVGTPPNLIGMAQLKTLAGVSIGFAQWMMLALPIAAVMAGALLLILRRDLSGTAVNATASYAGSTAPWSRGEKVTLAAFSVAVTLWLTSGFSQFLAPALYQWFEAHLPEGVIALLAASVLFIFPAAPKRPTLRWSEAAKIDWGTLLLLGGGLCMGELMKETGLARAIGELAAHATGVQSLWAITALAALTATLSTEIISNSAAATMIVPVVIAIAQGAGVSPTPPAIAATLGCSLAFMLPVSTPPNAMVYGTGLVSMPAMIKRGILLDLAGFLIILAGLYLLCPLLGLS